MEQKKLFLIDAYAIIYRAYYALIRSPRITTKGFNTSAVFGFVNTLEDILRNQNPSHIAVCFDPPGGSTFRNGIYPEYKAQREAQPEDITMSIPVIKDIIEAYNIPVIEVAGYEADDVIGTIARRAEEDGFTTYMMTPDKDYGQLVTDRILMFRPPLGGKGFEIRGPKEVCERYGIESPRQVIDLLALEGDASDNIPGCKGVGEKTAVKLIGEFGSVENLLDHIADLKGAIKKKVDENQDNIRLSKILATISTDVPLPGLDINNLERKPENIERLKELFSSLEFRTMLRRFGMEASPAPVKPEGESQLSLFDSEEEAESAAEAVKFETEISTPRILNSPAEAGMFIQEALALEAVGISVYAVGENSMDAEIAGIALSKGAGATVYIPVEGDFREMAAVIEPLLNQRATLIVSHDIKRDMILLQRLGISFGCDYFDTSVAHYLLQPEMRHQLSIIAKTYLGYETADYSDPALARKSYGKLAGSVEELAAIIGERALIPLLLEPVLKSELEKNSLWRLMETVELPFISVLASMEWEGMRVDTAELARLSEELTLKMENLEKEVYALAGEKFNIGSPKQVGEILFEKLKIDPKAKKTKQGAYSTTEEILENYAPFHPIVGKILEIRGYRKLLQTYINALPQLINPATGHIHTTLNQTVTATGRISSTNPNLQNIPIRTNDGKEIRRAFIPDEGCLILSADYSQIELRLLADLSNDPDMIEAFQCGRDFHAATAARIYHLDVDDVSADLRRHAKTANFGIVYGISAFGLSQRLGIPRGEAKALIDGYFATYPGVKSYIENSINGARENGYVTTVMGRKRFLPDINSRNAVVRGYAERNAVNAPLQGSAADIIKIAMIKIHREIIERGLRSRMIMQVHDELIFNAVPEEIPELQKLVTEAMENAYPGSAVKLEVQSGVANNWLDAH